MTVEVITTFLYIFDAYQALISGWCISVRETWSRISQLMIDMEATIHERFIQYNTIHRKGFAPFPVQDQRANESLMGIVIVPSFDRGIAIGSLGLAWVGFSLACLVL